MIEQKPRPIRMHQGIDFAHLVGHAIAVVINAISERPVNIHWQSAKYLRGEHQGQLVIIAKNLCEFDG